MNLAEHAMLADLRVLARMKREEAAKATADAEALERAAVIVAASMTGKECQPDAHGCGGKIASVGWRVP